MTDKVRESRMLDGVRHLQCNDCGSWKPAHHDFFGPSGHAGAGLRKTCRPCLASEDAKFRRREALERCERMAKGLIPGARYVSQDLPNEPRRPEQVPLRTLPPKLDGNDTPYEPDPYAISTAPSLGFLFMDLDAIPPHRRT